MMRPSFPTTNYLLLQRRWFVAKVRYNLKGFGPNGQALKINFCRNDYDLYDTRPRTIRQEQYTYVKAQSNLKDIKEKAKEEFQTEEEEALEYHNGHEWLPLTNIKEIQDWKGGGMALDIRVPRLYDDVNVYSMVDPHRVQTILAGRSMMKVIQSLVLELKRTNLGRSKIKNFFLSSSSSQQGTTTEVPTKEWILQKAEDDTPLRSVLLRNPGALDHMVQCLHYDITWRKLKPIMDDLKTEDPVNELNQRGFWS